PTVPASEADSRIQSLSKFTKFMLKIGVFEIKRPISRVMLCDESGSMKDTRVKNLNSRSGRSRRLHHRRPTQDISIGPPGYATLPLEQKKHPPENEGA